MITKADIAHLSVDELLSAEVEAVLRKEAVFTPTVRMRVAREGRSSFDYVIGDDISVVTIPEDGSEPESTGLLPTTVNVLIDQHKQAAKFITDRAIKQSDVNLEGEFLKNAPAALAEQVETDNITKAISEVPVGNQLTYGTAINDLITLNDIIEQDKLMNEAKLPKAGRFWMLSPACYAEVLKIDAILDASKRGNNDAIENGFVSKTMGFTFLLSNDLTNQDSLVYHESCFVYVQQSAAQYEKERQGSKSRDYHAVKALYGQGSIHAERMFHYTEQLV
jgi:hypothetical protein